jgi:hypothetical protein
MLSLKNVSVYLQDFGSVLGIFLVGQDKTAIEQRYFSFYNHEATGGDLEWWSDTCALFWIYSHKDYSAQDKLMWSLAQGALAEMLNSPVNLKGQKVWPKACEIAQERYDLIERVTWFHASVSLEMYDVGHAVSAEKGTGNFDDDVLGSVVMRNGNTTLDLIKVKQTKEENEEASICENV